MTTRQEASGPEDDASRNAAEALLSRRDGLVDAVVTREFSRRPQLRDRFGDEAEARSREDAGYHLAYLAEAVRQGNRDLFVDYLGWAKVVLARRSVSGDDLAFHLGIAREVIGESLNARHGGPVLSVLDHGLQRLPDLPEEVPTLIEPDHPHAAMAHQYLQTLLRGDRQTASRLVMEAAERGIPVKELYLHVFQRTQHEVGRLWQSNLISVAQEHYCTAATQLIMSRLYPWVFGGERSGRTLVATCVSGDLHELGVRMVADFFEMEGWDTIYLGANTPSASVVEMVRDRRPDVLAVSATILHHVPEVEALIRQVRADLGDTVPMILVGGYPFNLDGELWRKVEADGHGRDADEAIALASRLVGKEGPR
ncbi:MAG: cobalamin-dependent protein [Gemmatimonadota bacterium]